MCTDERCNHPYTCDCRECSPPNAKLEDWNLDDEAEVDDWIATFGTIRGRALARRLGLKGPGSARLATSMSNYAWNRRTAMGLSIAGLNQDAKRYMDICDRIYNEDLKGKVGW